MDIETVSCLDGYYVFLIESMQRSAQARTPFCSKKRSFKLVSGYTRGSGHGLSRIFSVKKGDPR